MFSAAAVKRDTEIMMNRAAIRQLRAPVAVDGRKRATPAWCCGLRENIHNGRSRVLVGGERTVGGHLTAYARHPGQELHRGDELGPYPMHAAEHQGRAEAAGARTTDEAWQKTSRTSRSVRPSWGAALPQP